MLDTRRTVRHRMHMVQPYLLQRLSAPKEGARVNPFGMGREAPYFSVAMWDRLLQICSFDYMGAAEYENGVLALALQMIWTNRTLYELTSVSLEDVTYWVIATRRDIEEGTTEQWVRGLATGDIPTRDPSGLLLTERSTPVGQETKGAIDLQHHWMVFTDKTMADAFAELFCLDLFSFDTGARAN